VWQSVCDGVSALCDVRGARVLRVPEKEATALCKVERQDGRFNFGVECSMFRVTPQSHGDVTLSK
jgi:hypothetical protein